MSGIFSFIISISTLAFFYFGVRTIISAVKKDKVQRKKHLKYFGITFAIMFVSVIVSQEPETKDEKKIETSAPVVKAEPKEEAKPEPVIELTEEEKAELAKKEAEEKAVSETKKKAEAEAAALAEANRKKAEAEKKAKEEADAKKIKPGTYKVGSDIPAGEYLVISDGMTYIESAKDSTGGLDSIIFNDNLMGTSHSYVTLKEGEYFKMTGGEMHPVASAPSVIPKDGLYKDGMYKVGKDIPAGEYKVILDSSLGFGYLEVSSNSSHQLGSIVTNENIQADTYITVKEGQYLKIQGAKIQK